MPKKDLALEKIESREKLYAMTALVAGMFTIIIILFEKL